jgi:hypothetical protein
MQIRADGQDAGSPINREPVDRAALLAEITALCEPLTALVPDEVTAMTMAGVWGCSQSTAQKQLERQVDAGRMTRRKALNPETGRECWAYRLA